MERRRTDCEAPAPEARAPEPQAPKRVVVSWDSYEEPQGGGNRLPERGPGHWRAVAIFLLTGFLSYIAGGYAAARLAGASGGLNGAMTAIFGVVVGVVLGLVLAALGLIASGGEGLPAPPVGFGGIAGEAFLAGLILLAVNVLGGYLGGKWGQPSRV